MMENIFRWKEAIDMTNFVLLGGNGYLGRNFVRYAHQQDPAAHFYVVSRSGKNRLTDASITNISDNITADTKINGLPDKIDYVVDFIGGPAKGPAASKAINDDPAALMQKLAEDYHAQAMGFIGGILGPKEFVQAKQRIIQRLQQSTVRLTYVEPTLLYGNGRHDDMTRWVPLLKIAGVLSKKFRPVLVDDVVQQLWERLVGNHATK